MIGISVIAVNVAVCLVVVEGTEKVLPSPNCSDTEEAVLSFGRKGKCICKDGWKRLVSETGERHCRKTCGLSPKECPIACSKEESDANACVCTEKFIQSSSGTCLASLRKSSAKPSNRAWIVAAVVGTLGVVIMIIVGLVCIIKHRRKEEVNSIQERSEQGEDLNEKTSDTLGDTAKKAPCQSIADEISPTLSLDMPQDHGMADSAHVLRNDVTASGRMTNDTPGERLSDLYSNGKIVKNRKPIQS